MTDTVSCSQSLPGTTENVVDVALSADADEQVQAGSGGPQANCASEANPVKIDGELSIRNADELHKIFAGTLDPGLDVVVDFAEVQTCDTAALQLICSLHKTAVQRGQRFQIAALSPAIEATAAALGLAIPKLTGTDSAGNTGSTSGGTGRGI